MVPIIAYNYGAGHKDRVETKPFDIKMGDYTLNLSGSTGLDQTIDYSGKVKLPASVGNISKLMTLDLKIGGSFTSPKVSVDTKSMANQAVEAVADEAISKLGQKLGLDSAAYRPTNHTHHLAFCGLGA